MRGLHFLEILHARKFLMIPDYKYFNRNMYIESYSAERWIM